MTVKELRDRLDNYIMRDPPDLWQLNDVEADAKTYKDRCKEREEQEVVVLDDGIKPKFFDVESAFRMPYEKEVSQGTFEEHDVFAICII